MEPVLFFFVKEYWTCRSAAWASEMSFSFLFFSFFWKPQRFDRLVSISIWKLGSPLSESQEERNTMLSHTYPFKGEYRCNIFFFPFTASNYAETKNSVKTKN